MNDDNGFTPKTQPPNELHHPKSAWSDEDESTTSEFRDPDLVEDTGGLAEAIPVETSPEPASAFVATVENEEVEQNLDRDGNLEPMESVPVETPLETMWASLASTGVKIERNLDRDGNSRMVDHCAGKAKFQVALK